MINQRIKLLLRDSQRTLMLIAQFSLAILALNMLISEVSQIVRSLTLNLGFQVDHLIVGSISGLDNVNQNDFPKQYAALNAAMTDLQKQDFIESAGYLLFYPYSKSSSDSWSYSKNFLTVDALNTLKLNLRFGDLFTKNDEFSTNEYCLINMESYNEFKVFDPEPIGKNYYDLLAKVVQSTANDEILSELRKITPLIIKGVVDNFHMLGRYDLSTSKQLIKLAYSENQEHYQNQWGELYKLRNFVIRLRSGENEALARYKIYEILNSHLIGKNLSVESCKQLEQVQSKEPVTRFYILLFICFILLIIIVAGIFAMTRINISRRIREIGIRAALGSTQLELKRLFFSEYLIISSISVCLSSTIIFLLNTFDFYRFQFTATEIVTVIIFQWSIIYLTVNKTIRTASTIRPTLALRYE